MEDLAALAEAQRHVQPGSAHAHVAAIGPSGIEVELACRLDVRSGAEERIGKTALMLAVLGLAEERRITLAG